MSSANLINTLSGHAFKLSAKLVALFCVVLFAVSYLVYQATSQALLFEQQEQIEEEVILLSQILEQSGSQGLVEALGGLSTTYVPVGHLLGVFNEADNRMAGNMSVAPDFVGWKTATASVLTSPSQQQSGRYHTKVIYRNGLTLVVGRSEQLIVAVQRQLILWLALGSAIIVFATIILGAMASQKAARKIRHMDQVLAKAADGDSQVRVKVTSARPLEQLDLLGMKINQHLVSLSELVTGLKCTASSIAHDLKTPLSHTQFSLYEAIDLCDSGKDPSPVIEQAIQDLGAINTTFDTILRIARINGHVDPSQFQRLEIWPIIEKIADFYAPVLAEKDMKIVLQHHSIQGNDCVYGDNGMLEQLLVNLLQNVKNHCPVGTTIWMQIKADHNHLVLEIRDNGPGVPDDQLTEVLNAFHRVDKARTETGSGLGLTLVSAIARHHNATLTLNNTHPGLSVQLRFSSVTQSNT